MAKYSFLMDIVHEIIGTVTDRGLEDSEIIKKSNEDEYSMYSENEVKELLTPLKKINSPCDMLTNEEDRQATTNDKNNDGSDDGSNSSQNDCVYGGGNNISYWTKRINQSQFNNDGKIEKQNSFNQSQNFSNMINNNVNN